ncbi:MAG: hypothetical protein WCK02_03735 [Bacteroidota bacterium]
MHKIKQITLILLLLISSNFIIAQSTVNSPYSRFGVGDIITNSNSKNLSLGGTCLGERSSTSVNYTNPASYSAFDTLSFVFETGVCGNFSRLTTSSATNENANVYLNHMLFGFPITKNLGASFGLLPFSSVGYNIKDSESIDSVGSIDYLYKGKGGLNQIYFGSAYSLTKNFSLGFNASYVFGNIIQERTISFPSLSNFFNQYTINKTKVGDAKFDIGIQYQAKFKNDLKLTIGGVYYLKSEMNASNTVLSKRYTPYSNTTSIITRDTIVNETLSNESVTIPSGLALGFVIEKEKKWAFRADISQTNWSEYKTFGISDSLSNSMRASFGFEFIPEANAMKNYLKKTYYRIGAHYGNSFLQLNNTQLKEYGMSFGLGLPVRSRARKPSYVNVGVEIGARGTTDFSLIKEEFVRINLSFSFYELWFMKRKYE